MVFVTILAKAGTQVVVPFREEDEKRHLRVTGDLGQIVPLVSALSTFPKILLSYLGSRERSLMMCTPLLY
jgi:hypothetical protein